MFQGLKSINLEMRTFVYVSGTLSFMILGLSVTFKLLHLQGANILLLAGSLLGCLVFVPSAARYLFLKRQTR